MKSKKKTFSVLGGDKRSYYLAKALRNDGYEVKLCGFDKLSNMNCEIAAALDSDILILPLMPFKEGKRINTPFSNNESGIDLSGYEDELKDKKIFTGKKDQLFSEFPKLSHNNICSYSDREEFSVKNAVPTAEGAINQAIINSDFTINGSSILVCGYGRIGKVLSEMLRGMGAEVTVSARKSSDLAWIKLNGFAGTVTGDFQDISKYNIIFNTVPSMVFNGDILKRIKQDCLIIDLASKPGGVDFEEAEKLGIKTIHALSLPGKIAPKSAGEIIESTILSILKEDDG
ncbi:MAG: dipicolinate synthase subunit DpsA [Oscillospiraceae bacterium]|nr:dipicolinate synthase subunit DpsA [Oscillospiraceae bacterium]